MFPLKGGGREKIKEEIRKNTLIKKAEEIGQQPKSNFINSFSFFF